MLRCDADLIVAAKKAIAIGGDHPDYHDHYGGDGDHYDHHGGDDDHHDGDGGDKRRLQEQH